MKRGVAVNRYSPFFVCERQFLLVPEEARLLTDFSIAGLGRFYVASRGLTSYPTCMRQILKKEINILLTSRQHGMIARLKETGINMSSLARLAIRKFGDQPLEEVTDSGGKDKRVVIYLEQTDLDKLDVVAQREGMSRSVVLRTLLARYLDENEDALNRLF